MKKFFILLFILVILGGAGFFYGWVQFAVPPGAYGVMRSKSHGPDPQIIREGEFRWVWYKLIPGNVKIEVFNPSRISRSVKSSGTLPSGGIYASLAGLEADFSWEISGQFSFSLKPGALPSLVLKENISGDEDLRALESSFADRIEAYVLQLLFSYGEDEGKMETLLVSGSVPELVESVEKAFPETEGFSCLFRGLRYPDYALYRSVRSLYEDYLRQQEFTLKTDLTGEAENRINSRLKLDELSKYGELLSRYPILLQYLALEKGLAPVPSPAGSERE
jgi:hypothetical protein